MSYRLNPFTGNLDFSPPLYNLSEGIITLPTITNNLDGTITVGDGAAANFAKDSLASRGFIRILNIAGKSNVALTDKEPNYLYLDYNNGNPIWKVTLDRNIFLTNFQLIPFFRIPKEGNNLHTLNYDHYGLGLSNKLALKDVFLNGFQRQTGLVLSTSATRISSLTAGSAWFSVAVIDLAANVSGTLGTLTEYYLVAGVWNSTIRTSYDASYYSNGTNRQTLGVAKYVSKYFFRSVEVDDNEVYFFHGNQYNSFADALAEAIPTIPTFVLSHSIYVGKIIIREAATVGTAYPRSWDAQLQSASVTNHNDLSNRDLAGNHAKLVPSIDSVIAIQVTKADATTPILNIDSTNNRIGINTTAPNCSLENIGESRFGDGTNYAKIEGDGTLVFIGNATVWNDVIIYAANLRPGITPPTFAIFKGGVYGVRFDAGVADEVHGAFELPHGYKHGTNLVVHAHVSPTTTNTGNIVLGFEYTLASDNNTFSSNATLNNTPIAASGVVDRLTRIDIGTISGANRMIGDIVSFRFYRQNGGTDTFTGNLFVHSIGVHYETDTVGSRLITTK